VEFEERVNSTQSGYWVYIVRRCTLEEDELVKARKKAKGNLGYCYN